MDEQLKTKVESYINKSWLGYQKFAKIQEKPIPHFEIKIIGNTSKEISNELYPFNASVKWEDDKLCLYVFENILKDKMEDTLYHEFTHIADLTKWANEDDRQLESIRGYLEYHAAQIGMLKFLGIDCIDDIKKFSMFDQHDTRGRRYSCLEYMNSASRLSLELLSQDNFPVSREQVNKVLGTFFNYLGIRSICVLYAQDYRRYIDEEKLKRVCHTLSEANFNPIKMWDDTLNSFLNEDEIIQLNKQYSSTIDFMVDRYKLY